MCASSDPSNEHYCFSCYAVPFTFKLIVVKKKWQLLSGKKGELEAHFTELYP